MAGSVDTSASQAAPQDIAEPFAAARDRGDAALDEHAAKALLARTGIAVPAGLRLEAAAQVPGDMAGLRPPFALKALSRAAIHKSDIGAVRLGLPDAAAVAAACKDIAARMQAAGALLDGFLVEEMAAPGTEIVMGGMIDAQLGPMIMLGAGGIHAEILRDASFRLCPVDATDAREMLDELRIAPILRGARGRPPVDDAAIIAALLALGGKDGLFTRNADRIAEFDINPLIARPDGLVAVDARIVLHGGEA